MRVQLYSMRMCFELDERDAMLDNDIDAYYTLNTLTQELNTCIRRVSTLIKLVDKRAKIERKEGNNGDV
jgi:hypothetical protein